MSVQFDIRQGSTPSCRLEQCGRLGFRRVSTSQPPSQLTDPGCRPSLPLPEVPRLRRATKGLIKEKSVRAALASLLLPPTRPTALARLAPPVCDLSQGKALGIDRKQPLPAMQRSRVGPAGTSCSVLKRKKSGAENRH